MSTVIFIVIGLLLGIALKKWHWSLRGLHTLTIVCLLLLLFFMGTTLNTSLLSVAFLIHGALLSVLGVVFSAVIAWLLHGFFSKNL